MTSMPESGFSLIVPTFQEAKNIPELVRRIAQLDFSGRAFEVILVDDNSRDGIREVAQILRQSYPWLSLHVRRGKKSLSASAMEGFRQARYPLLLLMDADLSHPPEKIPELLEAITHPEVDFVIGSRYIQGGKADKQWPLIRRLTSRAAAGLAQVLLSQPVKDPLSGFFALRKSLLLRCGPLNPIGWKIGLELMLKCQCKNIQEVPIYFSERLYGKSKFNYRVASAYLWQLASLASYKFFAN